MIVGGNVLGVPSSSGRQTASGAGKKHIAYVGLPTMHLGCQLTVLVVCFLGEV